MTEELPAEKIGAFHWVKLMLTSATTIKWLVVLILGAGTVTNSAVQEQVMSVFETSEEVPPIPAGETTVPEAPGINPLVTQSLNAMDRKLGTHDAEILSLKEDLFELEQRRTAESDRDDDQLGTRIQTLEGFHD
jgi:hypothetical protein